MFDPMFDQNLLISRLADPKIAGLSDADAAAAMSVPVKTPRAGKIVTYTTCAAVWGTVAAAGFRQKMKAAIAAGGSFGAVADYIDTLLQGPGIDPANAEVPTQAAQFVAAGLATQDQVDGVFFDVTLPAGGPVAAADVTAARAAMARQQQLDAVKDKVQSAYATFLNEHVNPALSDPKAAVPTWADFQAAVAGEA